MGFCQFCQHANSIILKSNCQSSRNSRVLSVLSVDRLLNPSRARTRENLCQNVTVETDETYKQDSSSIGGRKIYD
jgi:hypothetical protein